MLGLVLAVGIVIDDAVVVLENIFRHIEEEDAPPMRAASKATAEIALAVMATPSRLSSSSSRSPSMPGASGALPQLRAQVAVAIMISLLISFTLTPALSGARAPPAPARARARRGGSTAPSRRRTAGCSPWSLRHRW